MNEYVVIYEQGEDGGWGAYLPDLPGVVAIGKTREEVVSGIQESLSAYVEELQSSGQTLPPPMHLAGTANA